MSHWTLNNQKSLKFSIFWSSALTQTPIHYLGNKYFYLSFKKIQRRFRPYFTNVYTKDEVDYLAQSLKKFMMILKSINESSRQMILF
jgi:hypothetical protein